MVEDFKSRKYKYITFELPQTKEYDNWEWCYSAKELEKKFKVLFAGKTVKGLYIDLGSYLENYEKFPTPFMDISPNGGGSKIIFGDTVLELRRHTEGQFEYNIAPLNCYKITEYNDYPPQGDELYDSYLNIEDYDITENILNQTVTEVCVLGASMWCCFERSGYDGEKALAAANADDLSLGFSLSTENHKIYLVGYIKNRKYKYSIIKSPNEGEYYNWEWCYSAKELEKKLKALFVGKTVKGIYIDFEGYLENYDHHSTDYIDLSFEGGDCNIIFDDTVLELGLHAEGQFNYNIAPLKSYKITQCNDYPPQDDDRYYSYLNIEDHDITAKISNQAVTDICVPGTDMWCFSCNDFNNKKADAAAELKDLPLEIDLYINGHIIRLIGDDMEYYRVKIEKA